MEGCCWSVRLPLPTPVCRSAVLDYFAAYRALHPPNRTIFRFERSMEMGEGEAAWLRQLCLYTAFPTEPAGSLLPAYLSGESRLVLENYPELGFFRDVVFMFKMLMVPSSEALPEIFSWLPLDAALAWVYRPGEGFIVSGFQRRLNPAAMVKQAEQAEDSWMSRGFRKMLGIAEKPRAPPSSADPTALLRAEMGVDARIESEEDVLHLKASHSPYRDLPPLTSCLTPSHPIPSHRFPVPSHPVASR